jgi:hypothetical protein
VQLVGELAAEPERPVRRLAPVALGEGVEDLADQVVADAALGQPVHLALELVEVGARERVDDRGLVGEVVVQRADADADLGRDPGRGERLGALAGHELGGDLEDALDALAAARLLRLVAEGEGRGGHASFEFEVGFELG